MAGIVSPPSSFNIILQKGLAAHVERSSPATPTTPSAFHASQATSMMASYASNQVPYGMSSDAHPAPPNSGHADADAGSSGMVLGKKKRGRPRKYVRDVIVTLGLPAYTTAVTPKPASQGQKKGRGQLPVLGTVGAGFIPHVITIAAGEDIATKVMSLSQLGPRAVCILSANGAISNVRLEQPATSGSTVTYEGYYEILSLSGSFFPTKNLYVSGQMGSLSVSLAGPDGEIVGGGVAGLLMAASPVQIVIGSFLSGEKKSQLKAAKVEGLQKRAAVSVAEDPVHKAMAMHIGDSPLATTMTSADAQQLHNEARRSFTSLLNARSDDINISLSGG